MAYTGDDFPVLFSDKYVNGALRDMANAGGDRMHDLVVANTPIDSGNLRTSWYRLQARKGVQRGRTEYESEVRTDVEYAPYVEHGTGLWGPEHKRYLIEPKKPGGWLSWVQGGERVFRKRVWHPGSPGQFMMQAAAAKTEATADEVMSPAALKWARLQESLVELARARRH